MKKIALVIAGCLLLATNGFSETARDILKTSGVRGGLIVHLGCGDGNLTADLRASEAYIVHGLDTDGAKVAAARKAIQARGLYGSVAVAVFDGAHLPYAENLVNLLVASSEFDVPRSEILRVLAPNGVAIIKGRKVVKPIPEGMDEWTHWLHGPDGNAVARDRLVGPPRRLQWVARPYWARLHDAPSSTSSMVSSGGRVFYISDEGIAGTYEGLEDRWFLVARDAFNGTLLWKQPMPDWGWKSWVADWHARNNQPFQLAKRLVAIGDTLYVTLGFNAPVSALDAATGKLLRTFEGTKNTDEMLYHEGSLILSINKTPHNPSRENPEALRKSLAVVRADSGKMLWKKGDYEGLPAKTDSLEPDGRLEIAVGDGQIYFSDKDSVASVDLATGKALWRKPRIFGPKLPANFNTRMYELSVLVYNDGVVLYAQPEGTISFHSVPGTLYAYDAKDGHLLWKHRYGGWVHNTQPNVFVIDGTVWIHEHQEGETPSGKRMVFSDKQMKEADYAVLGLDLKTGAQKFRFSTKEILFVGHHHRCYRNKATERFLLMSRRGVEFIDTESGENHLNHWTRGECQLGVMPCNGLLYTTPHPCGCYINAKLNGFLALAPAATETANAEEINKTETPYLVKGMAYKALTPVRSSPTVKEGHPQSLIPNSQEWPSFRGNSLRSGSLETVVPAKLSPAWKADLGAECGPVTVADGKVFVPLVDHHQVLALDAATGRTVWEYTAGGRVDTPPTIHEGMALFGSADGWVYSLRVADGALIWKRRVAPRERLVGALGQLESAWPVHGSILVHKGLAYLAAGRSSYLDGGIHLYAIEPRTGEIIESRVEYSPDPETGEMKGDFSYAFTMPGMLSDILVTDGCGVFMRDNHVFGEEPSEQGPIFSTGGFRDDSWFNRTTWAVGAAKHAQLLVFDDATAYAIEAFTSASRAKAFTPGAKGYHLFAQPLAKSSAASRRGQAPSGKKNAPKGSAPLWSIQVPLRGTAMALAGKTLFVAGVPDLVDPQDPMGAFEGRKGALLCAYGAADGAKISEIALDAVPVWDGMALAGSRLFLATKGGGVICFE